MSWRNGWPSWGSSSAPNAELAQMSVRRLADLAGVSNPYLSQIERGLRRPSAEILQQLAKALKISVETLYVRAGFLSDDEPEGPNVREAITNDPRLTAGTEARPSRSVRELPDVRFCPPESAHLGRSRRTERES